MRVSADASGRPTGAGLRPLPLAALQIDVAAGMLSNGTDKVVVGRRGAAILSLLQARLGEAVPTQTLIDAGWPGYIVEEGSLSVQIASLRRALERLLGGTRWIISVPRAGYRLLPAPLPGDAPAADRWEMPTVAVLPLSVPSQGRIDGAAADGTAADGADAFALTDTLTGILALHGGLAVAPRSAALHYADTRLGASGTAAELGVRYLVEGSWLRRDRTVRVTLHLADTLQGRVIWTDRFDFAHGDGFAVADRIAGQLVDAMDTLLVRGEEVRIGYPATGNISAWGHFIRGLGHAYWPRRDLKWGHEMALAIADWERALALDPDNPALLATLGAGHAVLAAYSGDMPQPTAPGRALTYLQAALDRAPDQPLALAYVSLIRSEQDRFDEGADLARRALRLAPHAPAVTAVTSVALCAAGAAQEAVACIDRSVAATPFFPPIFGLPVARAFRLGGRLSEAIGLLEDLDRDQPKFDCRELVLAYKQAHRHEDAVNAATRLLLRDPGFTVTGWLATQHRADRDAIQRDADALRSVGLPE